MKQIYRNQETDEVLKHFRVRYMPSIWFDFGILQYQNLIMQQILGNTNHMIKGHDITSLYIQQIYTGNVSQVKILFQIWKYYFMCEKREIANQI